VCGTYVKPSMAANVVSWDHAHLHRRQARGHVEGYVVAELRHADSAFKPLASVIDGGARRILPASSYPGARCVRKRQRIGPSKILPGHSPSRQLQPAASQWEDYVTETDNGGRQHRRRRELVHAGHDEAPAFYVFGTVTTQ
jgi:hypothetical protein